MEAQRDPDGEIPIADIAPDGIIYNPDTQLNDERYYIRTILTMEVGAESNNMDDQTTYKQREQSGVNSMGSQTGTEQTKQSAINNMDAQPEESGYRTEESDSTESTSLCSSMLAQQSVDGADFEDIIRRHNAIVGSYNDFLEARATSSQQVMLPLRSLVDGYPIPHFPCTVIELENLDKHVVDEIIVALGLPTSTPTRMFIPTEEQRDNILRLWIPSFFW
ncbi:hypothetical protein G7046_g8732 [Stylonectria norvegica]|nr:hypothetical protein G7046_g8732 [Stylonectria norvegica]